MRLGKPYPLGNFAGRPCPFHRSYFSNAVLGDLNEWVLTATARSAVDDHVLLIFLVRSPPKMVGMDAADVSVSTGMGCLVFLRRRLAMNDLAHHTAWTVSIATDYREWPK